MQIAAVPTTGAIRGEGVPVVTIAAVDRLTSAAAPMTVFVREHVGRTDGYGSLNSALSAARNLSRGAERSAVVVEKTSTGAYQVREAVWRLAQRPAQSPADRVPFRHFDFEDGTFSSYTAWLGGQKVQVEAKDHFRAYDGITRWLVDGKRVLEVTPQGGTGR